MNLIYYGPVVYGRMVCKASDTGHGNDHAHSHGHGHGGHGHGDSHTVTASVKNDDPSMWMNCR